MAAFEKIFLSGLKRARCISAQVSSTAKKGTGSRNLLMTSEMPEQANKDVAFIELIRGERTENPIGVENGLRVIQLTEAAWQSAELGRPVKVDLS